MLTENTASVALGAGISLTLSNPPIMFVNTHMPVPSEQLDAMAVSLQSALNELLSLDDGDIKLANVYREQLDT